MAAMILNSPCAVEMSVYVVRAFVKLRELLASNRELACRSSNSKARVEKLVAHDHALGVILSAIRKLMPPPPEPLKNRPIGFTAASGRQALAFDLRSILRSNFAVDRLQWVVAVLDGPYSRWRFSRIRLVSAVTTGTADHGGASRSAESISTHPFRSLDAETRICQLSRFHLEQPSRARRSRCGTIQYRLAQKRWKRSRFHDSAAAESDRYVGKSGVSHKDTDPGRVGGRRAFSSSILPTLVFLLPCHNARTIRTEVSIQPGVHGCRTQSIAKSPDSHKRSKLSDHFRLLVQSCRDLIDDRASMPDERKPASKSLCVALTRRSLKSTLQ